MSPDPGLVELAGRRAIVTAASRGLGREIAVTLARLGARVAICSRDADALEAAAATVRDAGGDDPFRRAVDLRDAGAVTSFVDDAVAVLGGLDIVVTNAGGPPPGDFAASTDAAFEDAFALLVMSVVRTVRAAIPHLAAGHAPTVINVVSISARQPLAGLTISNVLRPAVVGLAKTLADELAPQGIRVNNVLPGSIHTDRIEEIIRASAQRSGRSVDETRLARANEVPLGRLGLPEELAAVVAFLASEAASFVTGTSISVDGGLTRPIA